MALNENQLILLDNIIYLDSTAKVEEGTSVERLVNGLLDLSDEDFEKAITDNQFYYCGNMVNGMNAEEWRNILTAIKNRVSLKSHITYRLKTIMGNYG